MKFLKYFRLIIFNILILIDISIEVSTQIYHYISNKKPVNKYCQLKNTEI